MPRSRRTKAKRTKKARNNAKDQAIAIGIQAERARKTKAGVYSKASRMHASGQMSSKMPTSKIPMDIVEKVCAVTDPFCPAAQGAKWHDQSATATLTFQSRTLTSCSTGAGGNGAFLCCPSTDTLFLKAYPTPASSNLFTTLASGDSVLTGAAASIQSLRVVSAGVRWWDIAASTAVGGSVIATEFPSYAAFTGKTFTSGVVSQGTMSAVDDRRNPGCWVQRPGSSSDAYAYAPLTTAGNGGSDTKTMLMLDFSGAASSAVLMVEVVINYEIVPVSLGALTHPSTRKAITAADLKASELSIIVDSSMPSFFKGTVEKIGQTIPRLLDVAATMLATRFGGPRAGMATHYILNG